MPNKHKFSFERKECDDKTKFIIHSPIHTKGPKFISLVLVLGSSAFLGITLVEYIQGEGNLLSVLFLAFCVCFCIVLSVIFFARFTVIFGNHTVVIGHRFWKLHRSKTIAKHEITTIRWDTKKSGREYYIYLIIETPGRIYRFQPLGTTITKPQPSSELQQFQDSFLEAVQQDLSTWK